ncbi:Histone deacetylase 7, partial [Ophiophagus hannah]
MDVAKIGGAVKLCVSLQVPQTIPMDLRIGQRLAKPSPDTALLALKQTQQLQHQFFLASLHQQQVEQLTRPHLRVPMDPPPQDTVPGKQEQELRLLLNKDKSKRSAVASMVVKQKLAEVILKKQQAALERTNAPIMPYRSLEPMEHEGPPNPMLHTFFPPVPNNSRGSPEHFPLRKTASEPNLKLRCKAKKTERRKNPLTRKESAPPSLKRRPAEAIAKALCPLSSPADSSPSSSSTPVSGCSSPNDSLVPEHGAMPGLVQEAPLAQRLRMQESSLAQYALQTSSSLPALTLGLPATSAASARTFYSIYKGRFLDRFVPTTCEWASKPFGVAPATFNPMSPPFAVPGLGSVPFHFSPSVLPSERLPMPVIHKPLGRTRSEPLPSNPRTVQQQLAYQQHHAFLLEHLKQQTQLGKRMAKSSEKPRLQQIPSSEDMEAMAGEDPYEQPQGQGEPSPSGGGSKEAERTSRLGQQPREELVLHQAHYVWEQQQRMQQQQLLRRQPADSLLTPAARGGHRPLSRAHSSPAPATACLPSQDTSSKVIPLPVPEQSIKPRFTTGIVYDSVMLKHQCSCGDNSNHPEHAGRIQSIWSRLQERGLRNQCECLRGRKATLEELQSVHTERHVLLYGTNPLSRLKLDNGKLAGILSQRMFVMLPCGGVGVDSDTIWNELHSSNAARWAAGSVTELAFKVASRQLKNGFAVVRPPGHHADPSTAMGFCFFNSVAIAARQLQQKGKISKILIVDWDVHHGNGTQQVFYRDPNVLYLSLHRYDDGNFFPGSGAADEVISGFTYILVSLSQNIIDKDPLHGCSEAVQLIWRCRDLNNGPDLLPVFLFQVGSGAGEGFTVNVAWTGGLEPPMGDPEYLAAFRTVVMPIAQEFSPDVVLVSAGFDAADGHPPPLGGYKVSAKYKPSFIPQLEPLPEEILQQKPSTNAVHSLEAVIKVQSQYWSSVRRFAPTVGYSVLEAQRHDVEEVETVTALASLSVMAEKKRQEEPMEEEPMNQ